METFLGSQGPKRQLACKGKFRLLSLANFAHHYQPLDTILNLPRIMATPHSAAQVSSLWTAYHLSRSGGTGRGYLCASIPLPLYLKMEAVGQKYPSFVVALPRPKNPSDDQLAENGSDTAYEFYFLQWSFHDRPPVPSPENNPFVNTTPAPSKNPQISTVLFTPLQEYKLRGAYATPYLVLTHYTDLASTHGISLLRGEITASSAGTDRYLLGQDDAQLLSLAIQKFYLWGENKECGDSERLLRTFHDNPGEFKWKELLKFGSLSL